MSESSVGESRRASIMDVALAAGVSRAAVSKVIRNAYGVSPAMRERVEAAIEELDYRPRVAARSMRGASYTLGFEVPDLGSGDFYTQVLHGAGKRLADSSYQLIVAPGLGYLSGESVLDALVDRQVDGIIAISSTVPTPRLERVAKQVPVVLLGRHDESPFYDSVTGDDAAGANLAMDHLLGLGHRDIVHLTIRPPTVHAPHAVRLNTYRRRMKRAGLQAQVAFVTEPEAAQQTSALLSAKQRPTAIFAGHDALAMGCLQAVADQGLTANDVAVVGYDNIPVAEHPLVSLTTVDQHGLDTGALAIEMLMERVRDGRTVTRSEKVTPVLRVRRSSGALGTR